MYSLQSDHVWNKKLSEDIFFEGYCECMKI